ncbi:MAG: sporadic carbohydrate cluster protein, TIGR04323 family [Rhodospirillales bacterium]|nr:sporadic carbohydrate cluster protein, TIGR04323 family [Rhodospirillales bacterium]MBO6787724.1 sporadic carbohydrate cluster protein, TIGR04323 family [Rhodospirillales bacterium]
MSNRNGLRGYIGSRSYYGSRAPQHVQNIVIRDYCQHQGKQFLLSATEYAMPDCFMMLERVMEELPEIEGIVLYSIFMLPTDRKQRAAVYDRVLSSGGTIHAAVEGYRIESAEDAAKIERIWRLHETMPLALAKL